MTTCLEKSCLFGLPRVSFVDVYEFVLVYHFENGNPFKVVLWAWTVFRVRFFLVLPVSENIPLLIITTGSHYAKRQNVSTIQQCVCSYRKVPFLFSLYRHLAQ